MGLREHGYGERVRLLQDPYLDSLLARVSAEATPRQVVLDGVRRVYDVLLAAAAAVELPTELRSQPTRMAAEHGDSALLTVRTFAPSTEVVVCDVIRGGIVPAQQCFERLSAVLDESRVRLDHLNMARVSDAAGRVVGVDLSGSKVGGSVEGAILILPDPMGATGSTTVRALEHYFEHHGRPERTLCLPMISTPEYLRRVLDIDPSLVVYTARIDRGLSPPDVLAQPLGTRWEAERGLDDHGYIVPGAGGLGEVLNNSWC
jgi:uracil phosphoribosyltransferase